MSGPDRNTREAAVPLRPSYLSDVRTGFRRSLGDAWMVTFADLVALMLTFFVLLFSMSTVESYKWQNLVRSLAGDMDSIQTREGAKPAVEFQIDQDVPPPGTDLDYLTSVIEQLLASEPALSSVVVWRAAERTVLSLPTGALFEGDRGTVAARARPTVYAIGRLLQTLDNLIEVHGHAAPAGDGDSPALGWAASLARAAALADGLAAVGYRKNIVARGYAASRRGEFGPPLGSADATEFADRIDVVIHEVAPQDS